MTIGGGGFPMYTQNDGAWVKNAAEEARLIDTMRKSADAVIKARPPRAPPPPTRSRSRAFPRRSTGRRRNADSSVPLGGWRRWRWSSHLMIVARRPRATFVCAKEAPINRAAEP